MTCGIEKFISANIKLLILQGKEPPWIGANPHAAYVRASYLAAPLWMRSTDLKPWREHARLLSEVTGEEHVLDHIVPVTHPYVCGLTVPWNIAVVPRRVNARKSNRWNPHQLELEL